MAKGSRRDPIPRAQEKVVISRSGGKCAYPACGTDLTIEPQSEKDQPKATGKVAHIAAASPGGPRYDVAMTAEQRGSADNLIYLCGSHHDAIDSQLDFHTHEFLLEAKRTHEEAVSRAVNNALGQFTYRELTVVCSVIAGTGTPPPKLGVDPALPIQEKIELNKLGTSSSQQIKAGLVQAARVAGFIAFQGSYEPDFGKRLAARFKGDYYSAFAEGLGPDEIFDYLVQKAYSNAGLRDTPEVRAAALAVIAYLFEICEIFKRE